MQKKNIKKIKELLSSLKDISYDLEVIWDEETDINKGIGDANKDGEDELYQFHDYIDNIDESITGLEDIIE